MTFPLEITTFWEILPNTRVRRLVKRWARFHVSRDRQDQVIFEFVSFDRVSCSPGWLPASTSQAWGLRHTCSCPISQISKFGCREGLCLNLRWRLGEPIKHQPPSGHRDHCLGESTSSVCVCFFHLSIFHSLHPQLILSKCPVFAWCCARA